MGITAAKIMQSDREGKQKNNGLQDQGRRVKEEETKKRDEKECFHLDNKYLESMERRGEQANPGSGMAAQNGNFQLIPVFQA